MPVVSWTPLALVKSVIVKQPQYLLSVFDDVSTTVKIIAVVNIAFVLVLS